MLVANFRCMNFNDGPTVKNRERMRLSDSDKSSSINSYFENPNLNNLDLIIRYLGFSWQFVGPSF